MSDAPTSNRSARRFAAILAVVTWLALAAQLAIHLSAFPLTPSGMLRAIALFLRFFTILTNLLIAINLTIFASNPYRPRRFFGQPPLSSAIAVYALALCIVYNLLLLAIWGVNPIDLFLHDVIPLAYLFFWWRFVPKGTLRWRYAFYWLIYPAVFVFYNTLMATFDGGVPYPFLDFPTLGAFAAVRNVSLLAATFLLIGLGIIAADRQLRPRGKTSNVNPSQTPPNPDYAP